MITTGGISSIGSNEEAICGDLGDNPDQVFGAGGTAGYDDGCQYLHPGANTKYVPLSVEGSWCTVVLFLSRFVGGNGGRWFLLYLVVNGVGKLSKQSRLLSTKTVLLDSQALDLLYELVHAVFPTCAHQPVFVGRLIALFINVETIAAATTPTCQ